MKKSDPNNEPVNIAAADAFFEIFGMERVFPLLADNPLSPYDAKHSIQSVLRAIAGQEGNDGPEYDLMQ